MRRTLYAAGNGEGYADVDSLLADFEVRFVTCSSCSSR